jgi:hypothetical protein
MGLLELFTRRAMKTVCEWIWDLSVSGQQHDSNVAQRRE